jgi:transposase-like protein
VRTRRRPRRPGRSSGRLLEPRGCIDMTLHAVVRQAYVADVSTRRIDDLVVAMGGTLWFMKKCARQVGAAPGGPDALQLAT